jgi:predicted type IV restriction endonuclease
VSRRAASTARKDFIEPLLKALGWDVDHEREHNPYEQEVKVESGLVYELHELTPDEIALVEGAA